MNSEELEISLRTEFEHYLKSVFADMRQEISQLQTKVETELENYKSQLDASFKDALSRAESSSDFDAGFKDSVLEHLRLARDEGARITAKAFDEAEELNRQTTANTPGIKELHVAINDISNQDSQGEILKTLVHHVSKFASRGAFFIVKKEHFVAWRTFDSEKEGVEESVHEVFLPVSADSILSESIRSLSTVESNSETYADDAPILEKLEFGSPEQIYAIPLVARNRGVAVLYADRGDQQTGEVNLEALETMVHVAGLTVEILASARGTAPKKKNAPEYAEEAAVTSPSAQSFGNQTNFQSSYQTPVTEANNTEYQQSLEPQNYSSETSYSDYSQNNSSDSYSADSYQNETYSNEQVYPVHSDVESNDSYIPQVEAEEVKQDFVSDGYSENQTAEEKTVEMPAYEYTENVQETGENYPTYEDSSWKQPTENSASSDEVNSSQSEQFSYETPSWNDRVETGTPVISAQEYADNFVKEADSPTQNYSFEPTVEQESQSYNDFSANQTDEYQVEQPVEQPKIENLETFNAPSEMYAPAVAEPKSFEPEPVQPAESFVEAEPAPVSTPPARTRLSERNVDLPIEVGEDERRLHNDARRFARLLVSEIKLYNEQKVKEGRESGDLYEKLREAIDRSREMYDKRVQPPVAAKFDYFHYELVNTLAEGDDNKLGASYPGSTV